MKLHHGTRLVAGVFVVLAVSSGFGFYNLAVYMNALSEQRAFTVTDISQAVGLLFIASGLAGLAVGRLMAVWDVRWVMVGGAAVAGAALSLMGYASEVWHVWVLYTVFGVGNAAVSLVPGTTVVTRWFPGANRSVALSIASTGLSVGGVLLTPLSAFVIQAVGVEQALPWFGAAFFCVIAPVALLTVRDWPPGGGPSARRVEPPDNAAVAHALRSRFFVGAAVAYVLMMGAQVGVIAHIFNHADKVAGQSVASSSVATLAFCSIVGRLLGGLVVRRFPIRAFTMLNVAGQAVGIAALAVAQTGAVVLVGAACFGVTVGNLLMLQPLLMATAFGVRDYPRIYSVANLWMTVGVAGGPLALGVLYDLLSYQTAFLAASAASGVALVVFFGAGALPTPGRVTEAGATRP